MMRALRVVLPVQGWLAALCVVLAPAVHGQFLRMPQAGDVFRDYTQVMTGDNYRVTDPNATNPEAAEFLPNPVFNLSVADLQDATRAEVIVDFWGGHPGTQPRQLRFNGNTWLTIPELSLTPSGNPNCYLQQVNFVVDVPLEHLVQGNNTFEGTSGGQSSCGNINWGQWGWYQIALRVYYNPAAKAHAAGSITSPASGGAFGDNPTITATASGGAGVSQVDFFAYFDGYDPDGDGRYRDWQVSFHRRNSPAVWTMTEHVGLATSAPYNVVWDTTWVPDQPLNGVKLIAHIRDNNGYVYVTEEVTGLTLERTGHSVRLYRAVGVPDRFVVRAHATKFCYIQIPSGDNLANATAAQLHVRTWNSRHSEHTMQLNGWTAPLFGQNHFYSYDKLSISPAALVNGTNIFMISSTETVHHGFEVLWPGPAVLVRYSTPPRPPMLLPSFYSMDEPSGAQINDVSGHGNHGQIVSTAARTADGRFGGGVAFDGIGGHVDLDGMHFTGSALTISMWAYVDSTTIGDGRLFAKALGTAVVDGYCIVSLSSQNRVRFRLYTTSAAGDLVSSASLTLNAWNHVAVTYDGAFMRIFVNGVQRGSTARTGEILHAPNVPVWLGDNPGPDRRRFTGRIDELRVYNFAQSSAQITADMNRAISGVDVTAPTVPSNLAATLLSAKQVQLTWTGSTDAVGVSFYRVRRNGVIVGTSPTTSFVDTAAGSLAGASYIVSAVDGAGNESAPSDAAVATETQPPSVPQNLMLTVVSPSRIDLSWTASTDNLAVSHYRVLRDSIEVGSATGPSFSDTALASETEYTYTVVAVDLLGNESLPSAPAMATTLPPDLEPPSVPENLMATPVSPTQVSLSWTASTDNVGIAFYQLFRDGDQVATVEATSYVDTGLQPATEHIYTVVAVDTSDNSSGPSDPAIATTLPLPSIPTDGLAVWLRADFGTVLNGSTLAQWTDQSGTGRHADQPLAASQPLWVDDVLNGLPVVRFDGADDFLTFTLPVNGLTGLSFFLVAASNQEGTTHPAERAALFWNETAAWGTIYFSPFPSNVKLRFGTTQSGNSILYTRPQSVGSEFTLTTAIKEGNTDSLYVDRIQVLQEGGKLTTISGCRDTGNIGRGFNDNTYFTGDIAEVLVFIRALTPAERGAVEQYLDSKYGLTDVSAPVVTSHPEDLSVQEPDGATFTVTAAGTEPLSYQWRRDGVEISGATGTSLVLGSTSLAADHGAQFDVVVTNPFGTAVSQPATLTVTPTPPVITSHPDSLSVEEPAPAMFGITATGSAPISYQWRRDGVDIPGATGSSYTLSPTSNATDDGAQFDVVVSNAAGSVTSDPATLTVTVPPPSPPQITAHPMSATVLEPNPAMFTVSATGSAPLSYQWRRNGVDIPGATGSSYTVDPTSHSADNGAQFDVVVSNGLGSLTSNPAMLTVLDPGVVPETGLALWLRADVGTGTDGSPLSQWLDQSGNDRHAVQGSAASQPVVVDDVLNGLPVVRFDGANDYATFNLPVNGLTGMSIFLVASSPQEGTAHPAERAALFWNETAAWGTLFLSPFPSNVKLRFGTRQSGNQITYARPASVGSAFTISTAIKNGTTDELYVNRLLAVSAGGKLNAIDGCRDTGNLGRGFNDNTFFTGDIAEVLVYTRALNSEERATVEQYLDAKYALTALTSPSITQHPADVTVQEPGGASFSVSATGSAPLSYQWRRNGVNIGGATGSTYMLASTTEAADHGAQFDVVVSNPAGSVTSSAATLTVTPPLPTPPQITMQPADVTVEEPNAAMFSVAATGSAPLTYQWRRNGVDIPGATGTSYILSPTSQAADDGALFDVVVSNGLGSETSTQASLTVNVLAPTPPQITVHPADATVLEPNGVAFSVIATGSAPLGYQWRRDGANIPGATSSTYMLASTSSAADNGAEFDVVVSNTGGSITSLAATLTVNSPQNARVTDGLVVLYEFAEGTGTTVHDVSGVGSPMDLTILDPARVQWLGGGNGVRFASAGSGIRTPAAATKLHSALGASSRVTLEAWLTPSSLNQSGPARIATVSAGSASSQMNLHLGQGSGSGSGDVASFRLRTSANSFSWLQAPGVFDTTVNVHHIVLTYDGTAQRVYVDGALHGSSQALTGVFSTWNSTYPFILGNEASLDRSWLGSMFLVAIYDRALNLQEVQQNFNAGPSGTSGSGPEPPQITSHPADQSVVEPASATFSVSATGTEPLSYQWRRNGVNIGGATGSSYSLSPTSQAADHGAVFDVVVSNAAGSVTSLPATLTVMGPAPTPPQITGQPADATVNEPNAASFSVTATGTAPLAYQWRRGGVNIPGATSSTYMLSPTSAAADNGAQFDVVVSNAGGSVTSDPASLTVTSPTPTAPQITSQPMNRTVQEPNAATFSVTASGTEPLSYQWRRGGVDIPGATGSSYTLTPTSHDADDGAQFDVIVSNGLGSATSAPATLTVLDPSVVPQADLALWLRADVGTGPNGTPLNQWTDQSGNNRHAVQASASSQPVVVDQVLNGLPVVRFDGANDFATFNLPVNGLTGMTIFLVAANTQNQTGGNPQAERAALFWNETASWGTIYLSPFQSMVNLRFGTRQTNNRISYARPASVGSAFTLTTAIKDGSTDALYVNRLLAVSEGGKLATIAGCRDVGNVGRGYNDNTFYAGDIAEILVYARTLSLAERTTVEEYLDSKYSLTGLTAPAITSQPANAMVQEPTGASFSVAATGSAPLSYQWRRDGSNIPGATSSTYMLVSTSEAADNGAQFDVIVSNAAGQTVSSAATLTVTPAAPTPPQITSHPASLSVEEPAAAMFSVSATGSAPLSYQWRRDGVDIPGATSSSYTLSPTSQASDHGAQFDVVVSNGAGSATSDPATLTVTLPPPTPPQITLQPASLSVVEPNSATFTVSATGTAPLSYQWRRNGVPIGGAASSSYTLNPTSHAADDGAQFDVVISNSEGSVTSDTVLLSVIDPNAVSTDGLALWLRADAGTTLTGGGLSQWADQSGNGRHAIQPSSASQPAIAVNALNGRPVVRFDGANDFLTFDLPVNGLSGMTMVLVALSSHEGNSHPAERAALFWNETAAWGTIYFSPFQSALNLRFGTTQTGNGIIHNRPGPVGSEFTISTAVKDGTTDRLFVDRVQVVQQGGKLASIAGCQDTGNIARGFNDNTFFGGDIAEILVYTRALTLAEREALEQYLDSKYSITPAAPPQILTQPPTSTSAEAPYQYDVDAIGNPTPTYSLVVAPSGMTIDPLSGVIDWVPSSAQLGVHQVEVQAQNALGSETQVFAINVVPCPMDIVSYWPLDETAGSVYEDLPGVNNAGCGATGCPTPGSGILNGGQVFDGNTAGLTVPPHASMDFANTDSLTMSIWINTLQQAVVTYMGRLATDSQMQLMLLQDSVGRPWFFIRDTLGNGVTDLIAPSTPALGQWHHIVGVYDAAASEARLYVDGALVATRDTTGRFTGSFASPTASLDFGKINGGFHFNGTLDEAALYRRALSGAEISSQYAMGSPTSPICEGSAVAPVITSQPMPVTVAEPSDAAFSVGVFGTAPISYQWRRNGANIPGATAATYVLSPTSQAADDGAMFDVVVSNTAGSATSDTALLTVTPAVPDAPEITSQPADASVIEPNGAMFAVVASGSAPLSYQWRRDGAAIDGATGSSYSLASTTVADDGAQFDVVVSNAGGSVTSVAANLIVLPAPPQITQQPASVTVAEPDGASFSVEASSTTPLSYQWRRDGVNIAGATSSSYTLTPTSSAADDGAQFDVVVSNAGGSVTSDLATLTVTPPPPQITIHPSSITVSEPNGATFTVAASGLALSYQWRRDGVNIPGATSLSYTLTPTSSAADNGAQFDVVVSNAGGSVTSLPATLTVSEASSARVSDGLVVLYDFKEGAGTTVNDVSGVGTPMNLTILDPARVQWLGEGNGVRFASAGSAIRTPAAATKLHSALTASSRVTLEAWLTPANLTQSGPARIATVSGGSASSQMNLHLGQGSGSGSGGVGSFRLRTSANSFSWLQASGVFNSTVNLRHVVLTYDGTAQRVYVDGVLHGSSQALTGVFSTWNSSYPFLLGNEASLDRSWLGSMYLVAIYDRALSLAEIQQNFGAGPSGAGGGGAVPPQITAHPADVTVLEPAPASFEVTATGTAPLSYQWRRNGVNLSGATDETYTLNPTSMAADDGALFDVVVSNAAGQVVSLPATLTVQVAPPQISSHPASLSVEEPAGAMFSVLATGVAPLSYQWRRDGIDIIGATGPSYTLNSTSQAADDGAVFDVVVSNAGGSTTSDPAVLTVTTPLPDPPFITAHPSDVTVVEPNGAMFGVTATGTGPLSYQWRRNGVNIGGATGSSYMLASTTHGADNGALFDVVVSNAGGSATSMAAMLTVTPVAPQITAHPANVTVSEPNGAAFSVTASGTEPLSYQWRRNGVNIGGATGSSYMLSSTSIAADNGAQFDVVLSNVAGMITSQPATLTVIEPGAEPPQITHGPVHATVIEPGAANFGVSATGTPPLSYQWRRNGVNIPGATSASYVLDPTSRASDHQAMFDVVVTDSGGSTTSPVAVLTVLGPTAIPQSGLSLWFRADGGTVLNGGAVSQWNDQSGNNRHAVQASSASRPLLIQQAANGLPALRFDGANDFLSFNMAVNGLTGMSIFMVAAGSQGPGSIEAQRSALFWNEVSAWGTVFLTPYPDRIYGRFGTRQSGNNIVYFRPSPSSAFSLTTAIKDGVTDSLYVNSTLVLSDPGKLGTVAGCRDVGNLGRGHNDNTFWGGDIAEVLVYNRTLSPVEQVEVEQYLSSKYSLLPPAAPQIATFPQTTAATGFQYKYLTTALSIPPPDYSLLTFPSGMSIDPANGLITWVPALGQRGTHPVTVGAQNFLGSDAQVFNVNVVTCPPDMISYWNMDNSDGGIFQDTLNRNNGFCFAPNCAVPVAGMVGGAHFFNGNNNRISARPHPSQDFLNGESFTLEVWVRTDTLGETAYLGRLDPANMMEVSIGQDEFARPWFYLRDVNGNRLTTLIAPGASPPLGVWHHVVGVRNAATQTALLYIDGVQVNSKGTLSLTGDFTSATATLDIGWLNLSHGYDFGGILDEVAIYRRALTGAEILDHYNRGLMGLPPVEE